MASKGNFSTQNFLNIVKEAIRGGGKNLQIREKKRCGLKIFGFGLNLKRICGEKKKTLIIK